MLHNIWNYILHTYIHAHIYVCISMYMYVCVYTHIHTHTQVYNWLITHKACSSVYLHGERSGLHVCVLFCIGQDCPQGSSQVLLIKVWCFSHQRCQRHGYLHLHSCKVLSQEKIMMEQIRGTQLVDN